MTHVFAHLGPAPYRYTGISQNIFSVPGCPEATKPGGSCDHCGTGIALEFHFVAADGRKFKVGSSCVEKAGDAGLKRDIAADVRDHARNDKKRSGRPRASGSPRNPTRTPNYASQGKTLADYLEFCGPATIAARLKREATS